MRDLLFLVTSILLSICISVPASLFVVALFNPPQVVSTLLGYVIGSAAVVWVLLARDWPE